MNYLPGSLSGFGAGWFFLFLHPFAEVAENQSDVFAVVLKFLFDLLYFLAGLSGLNTLTFDTSSAITYIKCCVKSFFSIQYLKVF